MERTMRLNKFLTHALAVATLALAGTAQASLVTPFKLDFQSGPAEWSTGGAHLFTSYGGVSFTGGAYAWRTILGDSNGGGFIQGSDKDAIAMLLDSGDGGSKGVLV